MAYTTIDDPTIYFNTVLYTGTNTSGTGTVTGVGFQPDFVWGKIRSTTGQHNLYDSVRGVGKRLISNGTDSEETNAAFGYLSAFDSDGFTTSAGSTNNENFNETGETFVAWNWYTGATASSNTDGSITSTVSANTTAGFSIGTYTGNSTSGATVGHGLSDTPDCIIVKTTNASDNWQVYHQALGNTSRVELNNTDAKGTSTALWNNTSPTSSVFSLGNGSVTNSSSRNYVFYAFAEKKNYSKFGTFRGNGSTNGTFVYTGFKPAWIMTKRTDSSTGGSWQMYDNKRLGYNVDNNQMKADKTNAEDTTDGLDILSNGFKMRNSGSSYNTSGGTYIYMAFAESPFVSSSGIPTTSR